MSTGLMKKFLLKYYPLIIILLLAAALRVTSLLVRGNFWFDEYFNIHFSSIPSWADTWKYWALETNPPLYTFFLRFYLSFADSHNEILVRLPSLIFGLISIALLYIFAAKIFSRKIAVISSTLMAFSVLHIFASVEARVYSLLVLLTISSFFIFHLLIIEQRGNKKLWLSYAAVNILLLYSHLTSLAIVLIQFLILHFSAKDKKLIKKWYIVQFISFALWSAWFIPSVISKLNLSLGNAWFFETNGNFLTLLLYPLINAVDNNLLNTLFTALLFIGFYILIKMFKETKDIKMKNTLLAVSVWAFLPIALSSMLNSFTLKYIIISYPALFMLAGKIIEKYVANKKSFLIFIAFILIIFMPPAIKFVSKPIFSWNAFNSYLEKNETDKSIILVPFIQELDFKPQYKGKMPVIGVYLNEDNLSMEERIVKNNWHKQNTNKADLYKWILSKTKKDEINRIFLLSKNDKLKMIEEALLENHWSLTNDNVSAGLEYNIIKFNAPKNLSTSTIGLPSNR